MLSERTDKVLANWVVEQLIEVIDAEDLAREEANAVTARDYAPVDDKQKARIIELLKTTFVGSYPVWRNVGWGLKNAGFSLIDFQYVTAGMMRQKSAADAAAVWTDGGAGCTLGTVIHLLKEKHGEHCLKDQVKLSKRLKYDADRIEYIKQMALVKEISSYFKELENGSSI